MKRTTIFIDEALESDMQLLAKKNGRPVSALVREAVSEYVRKNQRKAAFTLSFLGVGRSGCGDTAERHEDLLWSESAARSDSAKTPRRRNPITRQQRSRTGKKS
jgi:hypothetical protein